VAPAFLISCGPKSSAPRLAGETGGRAPASPRSLRMVAPSEPTASGVGLASPGATRVLDGCRSDDRNKRPKLPPVRLRMLRPRASIRAAPVTAACPDHPRSQSFPLFAPRSRRSVTPHSARPSRRDSFKRRRRPGRHQVPVRGIGYLASRPWSRRRGDVVPQCSDYALPGAIAPRPRSPDTRRSFHRLIDESIPQAPVEIYILGPC
jgi:hypothetical protein